MCLHHIGVKPYFTFPGYSLFKYDADNFVFTTSDTLVYNAFKRNR